MERAHAHLDPATDHETPSHAPPARTAERLPLGTAGRHRRGKASRGLDRDFSQVPVKAADDIDVPAAKKPVSSSRGGFDQAIASFFSAFFSAPGAALERLVGGTDYTDKELTAYLNGLTKRKDIEGDYDSDNKARAVIARWTAAKAGFDLTGLQKMLLLRELQDGATLDSDEEAILTLLKRCEAGDLRVIFSHIPVDDLLSDFDGKEKKELREWLELRFEGGVDGLRAGTLKPEGRFPATAPLFPYDKGTLLARIVSDRYDAEEIIAELARHPLADRERAAHDLIAERTALQARILELADRRLQATDKKAEAQLDAEIDVLGARRVRMEIVLEEGFKDVVLGETPGEFAQKAKTLTAAEKRAAREALKPEMKSAGGTPKPFKDTLPGENKNYLEKLRALTPGMIQAYWDNVAKNRQASDHADSSKMHTLDEMEALAKVSKDETDAVFGGYYDKSKHPPMKADKKGKRGNLHDLWADTEAWLNNPRTKFPEKQAVARALVFYFFQSNRKYVAPLNRAHNATPQFDRQNKPLNPEAVAQDTVAREFTATPAQVRKLNEIDRGWDASASPETREVNIQLFKPEGGPAADQDFMWDMFQTLIHEYLHTLVHPKYRRYAESFGGRSPEYNTLMEGMDSFLDEVVWANIKPRVNDRGLREKVEGKNNAKLPPIEVKHAMRRRYASFTEALRVVEIAGFRNVVLAYFKGDVEGIGA